MLSSAQKDVDPVSSLQESYLLLLVTSDEGDNDYLSFLPLEGINLGTVSKYIFRLT